MTVPAPTRSAAARLAQSPVLVLLLAVGLALSIRTFIAEPYQIPSESMSPTLLVGDHLFVNKFVYGARVPALDVRLPGLRDPRHGDVVVFLLARDGRRVYPTDHRPDLPVEHFVKRLVGLPGDTVAVREGTLWRNGEPVEEQGAGSHAGGGDLPETVVEPGRYFMLGDNRGVSEDSRSWGTVGRADLVGAAALVYWSWDWRGAASGRQPAAIWERLRERTRWIRIGKSIT